MPKVTHVKSCNKTIFFINSKGEEKVLVEKGKEYWWWKFRNFPRQVSSTKPKPRDVRHPNKSTWDLDIQKYQEEVNDLEECLDLELIENLISELEEQVETMQDSLSNMPEQLQESSILNERIEELQEFISTLEGIDLEER